MNEVACHEDARESGDTAIPFLTPALDGGKVVSLGRYTPGERAPGTHWIGGWVGPRAGLDAPEKRKISCPCRESKPSSEPRSLSLYRLSYPGSTFISRMREKKRDNENVSQNENAKEKQKQTKNAQ
jgi:hypothetical protein